MNLVIASDIHGSATRLKAVLDYMDANGFDHLVTLGDLLYHGPRNPLPEGHNPMECMDLLNARAANITAVRGNCDAEVDQMVLDFPCMPDYVILEDDHMRLFLTHGHIYNADNMPKLPAGEKPWAFCSGHTHVKVLEERNGITFMNPGSTSLPKDGSASFATYRDGVFEFVEI